MDCCVSDRGARARACPTMPVSSLPQRGCLSAQAGRFFFAGLRYLDTRPPLQSAKRGPASAGRHCLRRSDAGRAWRQAVRQRRRHAGRGRSCGCAGGCNTIQGAVAGTNLLSARQARRAGARCGRHRYHAGILVSWQRRLTGTLPCSAGDTMFWLPEAALSVAMLRTS